jgi:23S rRNA pseudouridine955/2504/2580 synthase/23S rRNA pseudouridine1911/1915/1917 synthase
LEKESNINWNRARDWVLTEQAHWVAIDKPSGVLSVPDRFGKEESLKTWLIKQYGSIFPVHRIDRDTSGLIIFARTPEAQQDLSAQFEQRTTEKFYLGFVVGCPAQASGSIEAPIAEHPAKNGTMIIHRNGKQAHTEYSLVDRFPGYALLQFKILTGRTHQIRIHAREMGHPIVCDPIYGDGQPFLLSSLKKKFHLSKYVESERPLLGRLGLHAHQLSFRDLDGNPIQLEAPLHKDMRAMIQQLRKHRGS